MYQLRIANIIGLDINNAQHSVAIDEAMYGVEDLEAFLEYCRAKKDGIEFSTKPEKLDTLATKYKKLQSDAKLPIGNATLFSKRLADKVDEARIFIKNELEKGVLRPFSSLRSNGEKYFTDKEINALSKVGSAATIIELSELELLEENLSQLFLNSYIKKSKYEQLSEGSKKVQALIGAKK